ncbi:hypothetical protein GGF32_002653 [Allomyces javanicus]|nr:hypothetical protein GGF32_002653 [Allomyces javanicus]
MVNPKLPVCVIGFAPRPIGPSCTTDARNGDAHYSFSPDGQAVAWHDAAEMDNKTWDDAWWDEAASEGSEFPADDDEGRTDMQLSKLMSLVEQMLDLDAVNVVAVLKHAAAHVDEEDWKHSLQEWVNTYPTIASAKGPTRAVPRAAATGPAVSMPATRSDTSTRSAARSRASVGSTALSDTLARRCTATRRLASDASSAGRGRVTIDTTPCCIEAAVFEALQHDAPVATPVPDASVSGGDRVSTDLTPRYAADPELPGAEKLRQALKDASSAPFVATAPVRSGYGQPVMPRVIEPMASPVYGPRRFGAVGAGFGPVARFGNPVDTPPPPPYYGYQLLAKAPAPVGSPAFGANGGYGPGRKYGGPIGHYSSAGYDSPVGYYSPAGYYSPDKYYSPKKDFYSPAYDPSVKYSPGTAFGMDPARAAVTRHAEAAYMAEIDFEQHVQDALHHGLLAAAAMYSSLTALRLMA